MTIELEQSNIHADGSVERPSNPPLPSPDRSSPQSKNSPMLQGQSMQAQSRNQRKQVPPLALPQPVYPMPVNMQGQMSGPMGAPMSGSVYSQMPQGTTQLCSILRINHINYSILLIFSIHSPTVSVSTT